MDRAGRSAWRTLASYTHGMAAVAAVDAIGIGAALLLLGVPLALSLWRRRSSSSSWRATCSSRS